MDNRNIWLTKKKFINALMFIIIFFIISVMTSHCVQCNDWNKVSNYLILLMLEDNKIRAKELVNA